MNMSENDEDSRTVFCGNLSQEVTDGVLFELFLQAGPVISVRRPKDHNGRPKSFAFVVYKHECSVPYALQLFRGTKLFNRNLNLNSRSTLELIPVLDTHLNEFTELESFQDNDSRYMDKYHNREDNHRNEDTDRHRHSTKDRDQNEPKSWAELNALRGKGSISNSHFRDDLQGTSKCKNESNPRSDPAVIPDFNALLQMGQQLILNGSMGFPGMVPMAGLIPMGGYDPSLGGLNTFPSMQGRESDGERKSPYRDRNYHEDRGRRRDYQEDRDRRRDHPYNDRRSLDHWDDHRRHDRGYSSYRSSHDRERRDRRSR